MKNYLFNYYPAFKCIASKCKHTCCAGWEIKIDSESLIKYKRENSSFSLALKKGINFRKSKFKTGKNKRCAFLNKNGLCDLITNLGEESLCAVCSSHPRFENFFSDRIETGLDFACEEATRIILSFSDKISPILHSSDNGEERLTFIEERILDFREKAVSLIYDDKKPLNEKVTNLLSLCKASVTKSDFNKIIKTFMRFERLDKSWSARLKKLKGKTFPLTIGESLQKNYEQFLVNSLYKHISSAEDVLGAQARTIAVILSLWIINSIFSSEKGGNDDFNLLCDIVRAYSSEVEYSEKNLISLYDFSYKFIKK